MELRLLFLTQRNLVRNSNKTLRLNVRIAQLIEYFVLIVNVFDDVLSTCRNVELPDPVLANEMDSLPGAERILNVDRRFVALDLFVAVFDGRLIVGDEGTAFYDVVNG